MAFQALWNFTIAFGCCLYWAVHLSYEDKWKPSQLINYCTVIAVRLPTVRLCKERSFLLSSSTLRTVLSTLFEPFLSLEPLSLSAFAALTQGKAMLTNDSDLIGLDSRITFVLIQSWIILDSFLSRLIAVPTNLFKTNLCLEKITSELLHIAKRLNAIFSQNFTSKELFPWLNF